MVVRAMRKTQLVIYGLGGGFEGVLTLFTGDRAEIVGCIDRNAELGVFRGDFARLINEAFPESALYLFDTFEGFDGRDIAADRQYDLSKINAAAIKELVKDTSVQTVLSRMPFPEKCVVKKGYFPDTTEGMGENVRFAFVSIDADLYTPILEGLKYFYPRMARMGMIFVHDYGFSGVGAGRAVDEFCGAAGIIPIPVADEFHSVMIVRH